jgi:hypothetical protein
MEFALGNGTMEITDKALKLINGRVLSVAIAMVPGACTDKMCPMIKKTICNIVDNYELNDAYKIEEPVRIEIPEEMYYSINKERQHVKIKASFNGKIEIRGLSLVGAV